MRICHKLLAEQEVLVLRLHSRFLEQMEENEALLGGFSQELEALEKTETHQVIRAI